MVNDMAKRKIQTEKVLDFMQTHDGITSWEAFESLNILSLPRRIKDLREQGYNIEMTWQRRPNGEKFGLYRLVD